MIVPACFSIALVAALLNVWTPAGSCLTLLATALSNVCADCGTYWIASARALTNECVYWLFVSASNPTLNVISPVCFLIPLVVALTNVCVELSEDLPTLTVNVFVVLLLICNHLPLG